MSKLLDALRSHSKTAVSRFRGSDVYRHNQSKGQVRERIVAQYLRPFLPACYGMGPGEVFSSDNKVSRQIDVVVYDAVFSVVLRADNEYFLFPCESVYGNIEVKSHLDTVALNAAIANTASLKQLTREPSDMLDITPISRLQVGAGLTHDRAPRNRYLSIVFALDGMAPEHVVRKLSESPPQQRHLLPDFVFNLDKGFMVAPCQSNDDTGNLQVGPLSKQCLGYASILLKEDVLPMLYLTLNVILNHLRLQQPGLNEYWSQVMREHDSRSVFIPWTR